MSSCASVRLSWYDSSSRRSSAQPPFPCPASPITPSPHPHAHLSGHVSVQRSGIVDPQAQLQCGPVNRVRHPRAAAAATATGTACAAGQQRQQPPSERVRETTVCVNVRCIMCRSCFRTASLWQRNGCHHSARYDRPAPPARHTAPSIPRPHASASVVHPRPLSASGDERNGGAPPRTAMHGLGASRVSRRVLTPHAPRSGVIGALNRRSHPHTHAHAHTNLTKHTAPHRCSAPRHPVSQFLTGTCVARFIESQRARFMQLSSSPAARTHPRSKLHRRSLVGATSPLRRSHPPLPATSHHSRAPPISR